MTTIQPRSRTRVPDPNRQATATRLREIRRMAALAQATLDLHRLNKNGAHKAAQLGQQGALFNDVFGTHRAAMEDMQKAAKHKTSADRGAMERELTRQKKHVTELLAFQRKELAFLQQNLRTLNRIRIAKATVVNITPQEAARQAQKLEARQATAREAIIRTRKALKAIKRQLNDRL